MSGFSFANDFQLDLSLVTDGYVLDAAWLSENGVVGFDALGD